jgi:hypothetical protein
MKNINFLKFKIENNEYHIVGLEFREHNKWTYSIKNITNGNRRDMSKQQLIKLLENYEYTVVE